MNQELPENPASQKQFQISNFRSQIEKPGYQTTEFYVALLIALGNAYGVHAGVVPGATGSHALTLTGVVYIAARLALKWLAKNCPKAMPVIEGAAAKLAPVAEKIVAQAAEASRSDAATSAAK